MLQRRRGRCFLANNNLDVNILCICPGNYYHSNSQNGYDPGAPFEASIHIQKNHLMVQVLSLRSPIRAKAHPVTKHQKQLNMRFFWKTARAIAALTALTALLIFSATIYDDISTQCTANKRLIQKISQHISDKPLDRYQVLKDSCTASTFCTINNYCPTSYTIIYKDGSSECADAEIEYFRGIFIRIRKCNF